MSLDSTKPVLRAAIYCRISSDKTGKEAGVGRQEAESRALAKRLGWEVVAVYVDNDISAYDRRKVRPQYRAMLDAVGDGEVRGVIAWHTDRLYRRASDLEEFVNFAEENGLQIQTVNSGEVNLSTASGRMYARTLGNMAQFEVEHARERIQEAKKQAAADGKYRGGPRPFGYRKNGMTVNEPEAELIREGTKAVLAGRKLAAIAREWNRLGIKTTAGGTWKYTAVRDMLLRPRNAGILARGLPGKGGQSYDFEELRKAKWPAIVPREDWDALVKKLTDPDRRINATTERQHLGSGIYRCAAYKSDPVLDEDGEPVLDEKKKRMRTPVLDEDGNPVVCGAVLRVAPHGEDRKGNPRVSYRCSEQAHLTIEKEPTDKFVRDYVARRLQNSEVVGRLMHPDQSAALELDRARRTALVQSLRKTERDYDDDLIDGRRYKEKRDKLNAQLSELDGRMAEAVSRAALPEVLRAADPGQAFLDAPIDVQRAVLSLLVRVEVRPTERRGQGWKDDRVVTINLV